jgi:hypothetical protein
MLHHYLVQRATIGTVLQLQHLTGAGTPWLNNFFHESTANAHALFAQHTTVLAKTSRKRTLSQLVLRLCRLRRATRDVFCCRNTLRIRKLLHASKTA